ncbi:hypothetical protein OUZ56_027617 [Daphnia magna]|uniref:Uncharacterized protein n=1 Tax=Daphnia magna TaxID=35525 RepID=A0ABR0B1I6_9CRUS|nr:hypothetical protein OUZ56_027617 [Daphnia magna]
MQNFFKLGIPWGDPRIVLMLNVFLVLQREKNREMHHYARYRAVLHSHVTCNKTKTDENDNRHRLASWKETDGAPLGLYSAMLSSSSAHITWQKTATSG